MDHGIRELLDISKLEALLNSFYKISGIPIYIMDLEQNIISSIKWKRICTEFHRVHPTAQHKCERVAAVEHSGEAESYSLFMCQNGLFHIYAPIIINSVHVANIYQGQFLIDKPNYEFFRFQADTYGFDQDKYWEALKEIPVISEAYVKDIISFLKNLADMIGELALNHLNQLNYRRQLETSQASMKFAIEGIGEGIWDWNIISGEILYSEKCYELTGFQTGELRNHIDEWISRLHPEDKESVLNSLDMHIHHKTSYFSSEFRFLCKDLNYKWFWFRGKVVTCNAEGKPLRMFGIMSDIQNEKQKELEAKELERLKSEFLANVSHELKTPINVIYSAVQLTNMQLNNKNQPILREKLLSHMNIIKQNCFRSQRLINNLIDVSKLDSNYYEIKLSNFDIVSIIKDISDSVKDYIQSNGLELSFSSELDSKVIACDPDKIERIMLNLISNAVKFTDIGGKISVSIRQQGKLLLIAVQDTGVGIPPDKLETIFDRFKQADSLFMRKNEGSGIGLTIVKALVEMHGGKVRVKSTPDIGSEFIVELPVRLVNSSSIDPIMDTYDKFYADRIHRINIEFSDIYAKM